MMAERFTRKYVREMYFNIRNSNSGNRIAQGNAGMGKSRGINQNEIDAVATRLVHTLHQLRFGIALESGETYLGRCRALLQPGINLRQGIATIMFGLTATQKI